MHIHILGICGTFMGSLAQLAKAQGHRVTGSDQNVYPPMSDQLEAAGIALTQGYDPAQLEPAPDLYAPIFFQVEKSERLHPRWRCLFKKLEIQLFLKNSKFPCSQK